MDLRQITRLLRLAASGSLVLMGAAVVHAGDRQHEQPTRPHMSAACSPNWGFNQTCWGRFPEMPSCQSSGCDTGAQGYENYLSQPMLYTPQNPMMYQGSQFVSPVYGSPQRPVSVFPNSAQGNVDASSNGMSAMPIEPAPYSGGLQHFGPSGPSAVPAMPQGKMQPTSPVPNAPMGLPPLPAPPKSAPGHSSWQPDKSFNQQQFVRPAAVSKQAIQSGSRYGMASRSATTSKMVPSPSAKMVSGSLTNTLVNRNTQPTAQTTNSALTSGRYGASANSGTRGSFAGTPVTNNHVTQNSPKSALPSGRYASSSSPAATSTSRIPVSFASQSRVLPKSAGSATSYRSGRSMPPVVNSPAARFQPTQLPIRPDYSTMPVEPLRSTP